MNMETRITREQYNRAQNEAAERGRAAYEHAIASGASEEVADLRATQARLEELDAQRRSIVRLITADIEAATREYFAQREAANMRVASECGHLYR